MKNFSRRKLILAILLVVTVIYPVALHLDIQRYEARKQAELEKNPQYAGIIDFAPYASTNTGELMVITGVLIVGSWLMVIVHRKKLKSAMLMVLMFLVVLAFTPRAHADYFEIVDVLAVEDEEFRCLQGLTCSFFCSSSRDWKTSMTSRRQSRLCSIVDLI